MKKITFTFLGIIIFVLGGLSTLHATTYYVSPSGLDTNPGTASAPFQTVQTAVNSMSVGDSLILRSGVYREYIQVGKDSLTIMAAPGDAVEISGFDIINGWTQDNGNIYVANMDWTQGARNQMMYKGNMMILARWPNKSSFDPFELATKKAFGTTSKLTNNEIPNIDWENGGVVFFLGKNRWTSWRVPITGSATGEVSFTPINADNWQWGGSHNPTDGGDFYLMNHLAALDSEGEWFLDRFNDKLYFYAPGGGKPDDDAVMMKRRTIAFNIANRKGVVLDGLKITGANIVLNNANGCVIQNCEILYGNHTLGTGAAAFVNESSIALNDNSQNNRIERNNIQWGAVNGIILKGNDNVVTNNYIGNFNYLSSYGAPVELRGANDLTFNEIFNGGRDLVRGGGSGSNCSYNDMHHANMNNDDCGPIYFCCGQYNNTTIHHNWIHDCESRDGNFVKYKATGIYLDNSTEDVIVHHNVLWNLEWTGIQINWAGKNLLIYNNTLWSNSGPESRSMGRWVNGYTFTNVQVYNTLANEGEFHYTEEGNNVVYNLNDDPFEDFANQNFIPVNGTQAIDAGRIIAGYTDNSLGAAPDVGAYERGDSLWVPGPNWQLAAGPTSNEPLNAPLPGLGLFPNPNHQGKLQLVMEVRGTKEVAILDLQGRIIQQDTFEGYLHTIQLQDTTPGLYMVVVKTNKGLVSGKLIVK